MSVEQDRCFYNGFVLTEERLRRIVATMREQIKKVASEDAYIESYQVEFKNGVISDVDSLEDVLDLDNGGSGKIIKLEINVNAVNGEGKTSVIFIDSDDKKSLSNRPAKFRIKGEDRDWVSISSASLGERIEATKKFSFRHFFSFERLMNVFIAVFFIFMMGIMGIAMLSEKDVVPQNKKAIELANLERLYDEGKITDPVKVLFRIEELKLKQAEKVEKETSYLDYFSLGMLIFFLVLCGGAFFLQFFKDRFPRYVFSWGEGELVYQKSESQKRFIFIVLVLGLLVSYLGGALANKYKL